MNSQKEVAFKAELLEAVFQVVTKYNLTYPSSTFDGLFPLFNVSRPRGLTKRIEDLKNNRQSDDFDIDVQEPQSVVSPPKTIQLSDVKIGKTWIRIIAGDDVGFEGVVLWAGKAPWDPSEDRVFAKNEKTGVKTGASVKFVEFFNPTKG